MFHSEDKIVNWQQAAEKVASLQKEGKKVVFTNGCFDLVHLGHVDYLEKARNLGDFLVVGINTDKSVSDLKGPLRPVSSEKSRARVLASMGFIDLVVLFGEPTPKELIEEIKPDILTKGNDYTVENIVGADFVMGRGGKVETLPLVEGYSTTNLVNRMSGQP
ncbi:MAG TPA: D-glycero-beta-D-manno-heptose 1-phosphate adenylyltransferase [Catalimonadaceae bacterium]|nr:D-glycero-beta-D-manno-heptose 1-phosphate adenylyltransferase [Catalimonadaceae bacterium]